MEQPTINIGILGHVANGKSSLVKMLTGEKTSRGDSRCLKKGTENREMTVQIGYSNAKIYQCMNCSKPECYFSCEGSNPIPACNTCGNKESVVCVMHISFVDSPGHRYLMQNMMSGAAVMDSVIFVVDATCKQEQMQTMEHLIAAEIIGINKCIAIVQNKIDLVKNQQELIDNYKLIKKMFSDSFAENSKIIPASMSCIKPINVNLLLQTIVEQAQPSIRINYNEYPLFMYCVRSFDVNKPGPVENLKGGIIGGAILSGSVKIGDTIEILPGRKDHSGQWIPMNTNITSLYTGKTSLQNAVSGGLIAIGTTLDPTLTRNDAMVGMCAGIPKKMPQLYEIIDLRVFLLKNSIGSEENTPVTKLKLKETIQLAIGAANINAEIIDKKGKGIYTFKLAIPSCIVKDQSLPISKIVNKVVVIIGKAVLPDTKHLTDSEVNISKTKITDDYSKYINKIDFGNTKLTDIQIGIPKLIRDGGAKLVWTNFNNTCLSINRSTESVRLFFSEELATQVTMNITNKMVIHGHNRYTSNTIKGVLLKYIAQYVRCNTCGSMNTVLEKDSKHKRMTCNSCGSESLK